MNPSKELSEILSSPQTSSQDREFLQILILMNKMGIDLKRESGESGKLKSSLNPSMIPFLRSAGATHPPPPFNSLLNYKKMFMMSFCTNEVLLASLKDQALEKMIMENQFSEYQILLEQLAEQLKPDKRQRRTNRDLRKAHKVQY